MKENKKYSEITGQEDLKRLAPRLSEIGNQTHFVVPEGYFDSLPDKVMLQIQSLPDFESVAQTNSFAVPDRYFDSLPTIIQQRIVENKNKCFSVKEWISENIFVPKYALALASMTLVVLFGVKFISRTISVESNSPELSASEIGNSNYLYEMDESLFVDALADQGLGNTNAADKSAEDYLIDNNIDLTSITEQL